ncbi:MAG TPA: helix-turn-helix domain-containing protein [Edaphobacter sp.]|nr:helix-turn-helix domain-containing protein [Edaphobacter sp.]
MSSSPTLPLHAPSLLLPPYDKAVAFGPRQRTDDWPLPGAALVWSVGRASSPQDFEVVRRRLPGLPLFLVLPPPEELEEVRPILSRLSELRPRAVLPAGPLITPDIIRALLTRTRRPIASELVEYLHRRSLLPSRIRTEVASMFESASHIRSITQLCRRLYTSRRTLGRHFEEQQVPAPSHWLQMARLLHVAVRLQRDKLPVFRAAIQGGYPDGFTMSNQMKRLLGWRPTEVRDAAGWEWLVESWIRCEVARGGFSRERYGAALQPYARDDAGPG